MHSVLQVLAYTTGCLVVYGFITLIRSLYSQSKSGLRDLPGPPNPSLLFGNFKQIQANVSTTFLIFFLQRDLHTTIFFNEKKKKGNCILSMGEGTWTYDKNQVASWCELLGIFRGLLGLA